MLVLAEEMPGPCTLDSVQLLCGSDIYNHGVFLNARVLACQTTVTELDSVCKDNYAGNTPDTAMSRDTLSLSWTNGEWHALGFEHPFGHNGSDNLIIEFVWQGDDGGSVYNFGYYTSGNRAVDARPSTAERGVPRNYMPRFRIHYSTTGMAEGSVTLPEAEMRVEATPNPFTTTAAIKLQPAAGSDARVRIYDAGGKLVRTLGQSPVANRQSQVVVWDGRDEDGRRARAGTYFCRLDHGRAVRLVCVR
ncbi:T9SS type A sorting domain-containing protein [candidate division WOR-3 bacterium]|nr:T9SS type A sorting domain-containing protein [candidate division WOR-3 bacterium]